MSIERVTVPAVVADGGLFAMATEDYWLDTGRPELYLQANLDIVAGSRTHDRCEPVHGDAHVGKDVTVVDAVVGPHVTIGANAVVTSSVLLPGAVIGAGAVVADSVVMGRVGDAAEVRHSVLGADGVAAPGETVLGERRPDPDAP